MSHRYFVDTNILMYAHDTAAGDKHARAKALVEELWQNRSGVVSTQVLQERQPKVSALRNYKLAGFSVEPLMNLLDGAGPRC